jgi:uncharacterized protein with FMN-binding domain
MITFLGFLVGYKSTLKFNSVKDRNMLRFSKLILLFSFLILACQGRPPQSSTADADSAKIVQQPQNNTPDSTELSLKTLLDYSSMDTCDGVFEGSYEEEHGEIIVRATVLVRLDNCRVTEITFLDSTSLNSKALTVIPERIIETQMLPVETVTGASVSSWTIMTATALALGIDLLDLEE